MTGGADRQQIRRDAQWWVDRSADCEGSQLITLGFAETILALLTELEQAEKEIDQMDQEITDLAIRLEAVRHANETSGGTP